MALVDILLSSAIPTLVIIHLVVAPYTKVEESFNIQAVHDILAYGTPISDVYHRLSSQYDHFDFPGAVPRTFVGSLLLAGIAQPIVAVVGFRHAQFVVRAVLGLFNAGCLLVFKAHVQREFGKPTARWYTLLQASQFHVLYYASRTLPNMFAFGLTTLAFAQLVGNPQTLTLGRCRLAIGLLTCATAVFRSELAILLTTTTVYLVVMRRVPVKDIIWAFTLSFVFSLAISVPIDSYFWQKPLWPELWGFYFNAVLGSSSEWGVSSWHYYYTNALWKLLLNPVALILLIPLAISRPGTRQQARALYTPSVAFIAIYSLQPHKEARFIFYVVPPLTAAAALGANYIFTRRARSKLYAVGSLAVASSVLASFALSIAMVVMSSLNYPGGDALSALQSLVITSPDLQTVMVHTDVLSCMTGVTLFGQHPHPPNTETVLDGGVSLVFDKTEKPSTLGDPDFWNRFDYVLAEDPSKVLGSWETIGIVEGLAGVEMLKPGQSAQRDQEEDDVPVLGRGAVLRQARDFVRRFTGGWWLGPRMEPRIRILKRLRRAPRKEVAE